MQILKRLINLSLDFLFPPTSTWLEIREWNKDDVVKNCSKSNHPNAIFIYRDKRVQEMIHSIKFRGDRYFVEILGELLWQEISDKKGICIPMPIHRIRRKERGFNQCEWLCEEIKKHDIENNLIYDPQILIREKYTKKQSWSNLKERENNIRDVFSVNKNIINQNIILIDDVITTGSTVNEARRILLKAGANKVDILTIAH